MRVERGEKQKRRGEDRSATPFRWSGGGAGDESAVGSARRGSSNLGR
jgi:hypothetical protein